MDVDTGFGGAFNIARTVKSLIKFGAGAMHIEDQVQAKRCGHRPGKEIVPQDEMVDRIKAAVDARTDPDFVIMARTDALAVEGLEAAIERARACVEAGADMIFPEAMTELAMYRKFADAVERAGAGQHHRVRPDTAVHGRGAALGATSSLVLYPLSAFRAMNQAALHGLRDDPPRGHAEERAGRDADARPSCTTTSTTTSTSRSSTQLFAKESHR